MSFEIPGKLKKLGFDSVGDVDELEVGDMLVIPSLYDAPKLRVSLSTIRKWGLSTTSDTGITRYGCNGYHAVRSVFGSVGRMIGSTDECESCHVLKVDVVRKDRNSEAENCEPRFSFENANSIENGKMKVERPKIPTISIVASKMSPQFPLLGVDGFPETLTKESDTVAMDILMKAVGKNHIPTSSLAGRISSDKEYGPDIPMSSWIISCLLGEGARSKVSARLKSDHIHRLKNVYEHGGNDMFRSALIASPHCAESSRQYCEKYFKFSQYDCDKTSITMPARFVRNILKRGALLLRSPGMRELSSVIMAKAVSDSMEKRYGESVRVIENVIESLKSELDDLKGIHEAYVNASNSMKIEKSVLNDIEKMFGKA